MTVQEVRQRPPQSPVPTRPAGAGRLVTAAAVLLVVVDLTGLSDVVGYHAGISLYLTVLALAVGGLAFAAVTGRIRVRWSPVLLLAAIWLASLVPSLAAAYDPGTALATFVEHGKSLVFLAVVLLVVAGTDRAGTLVQAAVLSVAAMALLSLVNEFVLHDSTNLLGFSNVPKASDVGGATARHSGPDADPNFWGRTLVLFLPLALGLYAARVRLLGRSGRLGSPRWWLVAALAIAGGIYLTGSRGALLAAAAAVVLWLLLAGRRYRLMLLLAPVAVVLLALVPGIGSRLGTLTDLSEVQQGQGDPSLVARAAAQEVGLAMVRARPAFGVGAGNFGIAWHRYAAASSDATLVQVAPHDLYLQMAAEAGLVGLAGWLVFYGGVMLLALRAYLAMTGPRPPPERALLAGLLASLAAWALASVVLHLNDERALFTVFAAVGAYALAERRRPAPATTQRPRPVRVWRRRLVVLGAGTAAVGLVLLAGLVSGMRTTAYAAQVVVPIHLSRPGSSGTPYYYDLLSRQSLVPTYATLLSGAGARARAGRESGLPVDAVRAARVTVSGDDRSLLLRVSARSPDQEVARRLAERVARDGRELVRRTSNIYRLGTPRAVRVSVVTPVDRAKAAVLVSAAVLAGVVAGCGAGVAYDLWRESSRRRRPLWA